MRFLLIVLVLVGGCLIYPPTTTPAQTTTVEEFGQTPAQVVSTNTKPKPPTQPTSITTGRARIKPIPAPVKTVQPPPATITLNTNVQDTDISSYKKPDISCTSANLDSMVDGEAKLSTCEVDFYQLDAGKRGAKLHRVTGSIIADEDDLLPIISFKLRASDSQGKLIWEAVTKDKKKDDSGADFIFDLSETSASIPFGTSTWELSAIIKITDNKEYYRYLITLFDAEVDLPTIRSSSESWWEDVPIYFADHSIFLTNQNTMIMPSGKTYQEERQIEQEKSQKRWQVQQDDFDACHKLTEPAQTDCFFKFDLKYWSDPEGFEEWWSAQSKKCKSKKTNFNDCMVLAFAKDRLEIGSAKKDRSIDKAFWMWYF